MAFAGQTYCFQHFLRISLQVCLFVRRRKGKGWNEARNGWGKNLETNNWYGAQNTSCPSPHSIIHFSLSALSGGRAGWRTSWLPAGWLGPKSKYNTHTNGEEQVAQRAHFIARSAFLQSPPPNTYQWTQTKAPVAEEQRAQLFPFAAPLHNSIKKEDGIFASIRMRGAKLRAAGARSPRGICMLLGCRLRAGRRVAWHQVLSQKERGGCCSLGRLSHDFLALPKYGGEAAACRTGAKWVALGSSETEFSRLSTQLKICGRRSALRPAAVLSRFGPLNF